MTQRDQPEADAEDAQGHGPVGERELLGREGGIRAPVDRVEGQVERLDGME